MNKEKSGVMSDPIVVDQVMIALRKIIRSIDMNSKKLVKRVGLTGPQLLILREISRSVETTPGEIAREVSLSQATVTGILERMEKHKLLTRKRSESDRRRIMVRITKKGKEIHRKHRREVIPKILGSLSQKERKQLRTVLVKLREATYAELSPQPLFP